MIPDYWTSFAPQAAAERARVAAVYRLSNAEIAFAAALYILTGDIKHGHPVHLVPDAGGKTPDERRVEAQRDPAANFAAVVNFKAARDEVKAATKHLEACKEIAKKARAEHDLTIARFLQSTSSETESGAS